MLRFYISIKNNLIIGAVIKKLLWSQNRAYFVEFGWDRLYYIKGNIDAWFTET